MHIYIYIYIYICNHENDVPSGLSPQWLFGNCTSCAKVDESHRGDNREGTLFS